MPIRHILHLSYEPKIAKKGGSCYQLWTIKQVPFFSGKITIFQPTACLPGYCKVPIWANGWFLWPKWVPRHIRTCPRFNFENKNLGSGGQISASRTTVPSPLFYCFFTSKYLFPKLSAHFHKLELHHLQKPSKIFMFQAKITLMTLICYQNYN